MLGLGWPVKASSMSLKRRFLLAGAAKEEKPMRAFMARVSASRSSSEGGLLLSWGLEGEGGGWSAILEIGEGDLGCGGVGVGTLVALKGG